MSGKVPPSSRAKIRRAKPSASDIERGFNLYERFTGDPERRAETIQIPPLPKAVAVIGELDGVLYTTIRDGVKEKYIHKFAAKDKPVLCISPDGRQIVLVGGNYVFTERGIVDMSDKKNLPRGA